MLIIGLIIGAIAASVPIIAAMVVTIAIRREESAWSLGGCPRGAVQATARRIMDYHSDARATPSRATLSRDARAPRQLVGR